MAKKEVKEAVRAAKQKTNLDAVLKNIRKEYGDDAVLVLAGDGAMPEIERRSSGILVLDEILGGGYPTGRIIEVYGPESSGKTTLCLTAVAAAQKRGEQCAYIDMEHALDPVYAQKIGVDLGTLLFSQPDNGEMALDIAESLMTTGEVSLIVVDSVAALTPIAELNGEVGDANIGLLARLMSSNMRRILLAAANSHCIIIFVNQIREKINGGYGNPETTPGGRALKFFASVRLDIRRKDKIEEGGVVVGHNTAVKTVKNKTFPPFRTCTFNIMFNRGVDIEGCVVDAAMKKGLISQAGAWYNYDGQRFQGRSSVLSYFMENEDALAELQDRLAEGEKGENV